MDSCCTFGGDKSALCKVACWLILIGAINWGLIGVGFFLGKDLDVVHMVLATLPQVENIVYILIGLAALMKIVKLSGGKCH